MKIDLTTLPSKELPDILRHAAKVAEQAGIIPADITITKTHLIIKKQKDNGK